MAKKLCQRRMAIGADGLMVVEKPVEGGDFKMLFYNADGSLGEMCGTAPDVSPNMDLKIIWLARRSILKRLPEWSKLGS